MNHKIKMIGFDLDGTLLTTEKQLTERTRKALDEAIRQGVVVLAVTGRPFSGVPEVIREFGGIHYLITSNGARVVEDGKFICDQLLGHETAGKILDIFEEYDTLRELYFDGQGYAQESALQEIEKYISTAAMAGYITSSRIAVPDIREKFESERRPLDKIQALFARLEDKEEALERIRALGGVEATGALRNNIEVNAENVHKGRAILWLADRLGIKKEEIMTFGDGANDLQMIECAGVGVAMANGVEEVRKAADIIAETNDADGVAKVIEEYVLAKSGIE